MFRNQYLALAFLFISIGFIPLMAQSSAEAAIDPVNFYFPKNAYKFKVTESIKDYVAELKSFIEKNETYKVKLDGYSQDGSNDAWNTRVSKYRVRAVRDLLIDSGINKTKIQIDYFGKTNHIAKDDSGMELAKNRRVELRVVQKG